MPITEILARNAALYGEEISLVEINPEIKEVQSQAGRITNLSKPIPKRDTGGR